MSNSADSSPDTPDDDTTRPHDPGAGDDTTRPHVVGSGDGDDTTRPHVVGPGDGDDTTRPHVVGPGDGNDTKPPHGPGGDDTTRPHGQEAGGRDETTVPRRADVDATQVHPRVRGGHPPADGDATRPHRAGDEDATRAHWAADGGTRVQPTASVAEDRERWSARAGVPSPEEAALRRPAPPEWVEEEEDPYQGRSWLTPVVVGIVALILVAALSFGLYLIYRATANGENAPDGVEPSPATVAPSSAAPSSAPPASSAAPSSEAPSSAPPPGQVVIPPLRGDTLAEATVKLQVLGLNVDVQRKADDSLPAGEVLSSRPGAGETVAAGATVTLIVAAPESPAPSKPRPSASASR
jgi:hypothetical protein